jgi:hypothetical protein
VNPFGDHDDFKRLLLSLPLQPIAGNRYRIWWKAELPNQLPSMEYALVLNFYRAGGEEFVNMKADMGDGGMALSKWFEKVKAGDIAE